MYICQVSAGRELDPAISAELPTTQISGGKPTRVLIRIACKIKKRRRRRRRRRSHMSSSGRHLTAQCRTPFGVFGVGKDENPRDYSKTQVYVILSYSLERHVTGATSALSAHSTPDDRSSFRRPDHSRAPSYGGQPSNPS